MGKIDRYQNTTKHNQSANRVQISPDLFTYTDDNYIFPADVVISGPLRAHRETSNRKASSPEQAHTITSPSLPDRTNVKHVGKGPDLAYANMHLYGNEAPVTRAIRVPDLRQYLRDVRKNQGILVREFQVTV